MDVVAALRETLRHLPAVLFGATTDRRAVALHDVDESHYFASPWIRRSLIARRSWASSCCRSSSLLHDDFREHRECVVHLTRVAIASAGARPSTWRLTARSIKRCIARPPGTGSWGVHDVPAVFERRRGARTADSKSLVGGGKAPGRDRLDGRHEIRCSGGRRRGVAAATVHLRLHVGQDAFRGPRGRRSRRSRAAMYLPVSPIRRVARCGMQEFDSDCNRRDESTEIRL
jgi:hypothetical protein